MIVAVTTVKHRPARLADVRIVKDHYGRRWWAGVMHDYMRFHFPHRTFIRHYQTDYYTGPI